MAESDRYRYLDFEAHPLLEIMSKNQHASQSDSRNEEVISGPRRHSHRRDSFVANPSAELMTIAAWLEAVGDGLGAHAHIIEGYGAADVALLSALDEEDINEIIDLLRRSPGAPPPLQVKLISKALASEVKRHAKRAAKHDRVHTPATDPIPNRGNGSASKGTAASDSDSGLEEPVAEPAVEPVAKPCWHKTPGCNLSGKHNGMPCSSQAATGPHVCKRKLVD